MLTLALALSFAAPATGADLAEIQASGKLRVLAVLDPNRPEFFSTAPDRAPGFDHEIVQGFARLHKLELRPTPRIESIDALKGVKVGTSTGSSMAEVVRKAGVPASRVDESLPKDAPALLEALDSYIKNTRKSLTWNRLVVKYFGESAPEILRLAREK